MTLHRRIIRSLTSLDDLSLRSICRQAAQVRLKSAMDFVSSLRPEHLQSFWYSASKYNFALVGTFISLLWATSIDRQDANIYKKSLDEYRWVLRLSSKSADFLEHAINMLASSTGVLVKAIPDKPDEERVLSRNLRRARNVSTNVPELTRHGSSGLSEIYRSESELHEDTSPDQTIGDTPSDSGLLARAWNVDHAWFSTVGDMSGGFGEENNEAGMSNYLGLDDAHVGFNYDLHQ
jgi:hypothetical protein